MSVSKSCLKAFICWAKSQILQNFIETVLEHTKEVSLKVHKEIILIYLYLIRNKQHKIVITKKPSSNVANFRQEEKTITKPNYIHVIINSILMTGTFDNIPKVNLYSLTLASNISCYR